MASKLGAIATQIITDIKTTSVQKAQIGLSKYGNQFWPVAHVVFDGITADGDLNNVDDVTFNMRIMVQGNTFDETMTVLEDLLILWEGNAKRTVLNGLGVLNIQPYLMEPPATNEMYGDLEGYYGQIVFELIVRFNYTSP